MFEWFIARKERKQRDRFDAGFSWVMLRYYRYGEPTYYIADSMASAYDRNEFDDGAELALSMLPDVNESWENAPR